MLGWLDFLIGTMGRKSCVSLAHIDLLIFGVNFWPIQSLTTAIQTTLLSHEIPQHFLRLDRSYWQHSSAFPQTTDICFIDCWSERNRLGIGNDLTFDLVQCYRISVLYQWSIFLISTTLAFEMKKQHLLFGEKGAERCCQPQTISEQSKILFVQTHRRTACMKSKNWILVVKSHWIRWESNLDGFGTERSDPQTLTCQLQETLVSIHAVKHKLWLCVIRIACPSLTTKGEWELDLILYLVFLLESEFIRVALL